MNFANLSAPWARRRMALLCYKTWRESLRWNCWDYQEFRGQSKSSRNIRKSNTNTSSNVCSWAEKPTEGIKFFYVSKEDKQENEIHVGLESRYSFSKMFLVHVPTTVLHLSLQVHLDMRRLSSGQFHKAGLTFQTVGLFVAQ